MRIALVQVAVGPDPSANRDAIEEALRPLESDGVDLVVLPEAAMRDFGSSDDDLAAIAEPLDGPFVASLADCARRLKTTIAAGMFEATDDLPYNTVVALDPQGSLAATYRKIHLYDSFGYRESDRLRAGPLEPIAIEAAGVSVGLMTCYDLRFPELARSLMDLDPTPELLAVPAAWKPGDRKLDHWRVLLAARAVENTVYVAAVNQAGDRCVGHSLVADPWGSIVNEVHGVQEAVLRVDLDPRIVARTREVNPSLANRRMRPT